MKAILRICLLALAVSQVLVLFTAPAAAATIVYAITDFQQFGTLDLTSGRFNQIGPDTPDSQDGLVMGPGGSFLALSISGYLESINPANGVVSLIGPTGLGDLANDMAELGGTLYATDFNNNIYTVNRTTGAATLIGAPVCLPPRAMSL